jgi:hypothetical protein
MQPRRVRAPHQTRRLVLRVAALVLLGARGVALFYVVRLAAIGTAYKAKMLCSGVFVSGRDQEDVLADLEVEDLRVLRHVRVSTDRAMRSVEARIPGLLSRQAAYRDGLGCALDAAPGRHSRLSKADLLRANPRCHRPAHRT